MILHKNALKKGNHCWTYNGLWTGCSVSPTKISKCPCEPHHLPVVTMVIIYQYSYQQQSLHFVCNHKLTWQLQRVDKCALRQILLWLHDSRAIIIFYKTIEFYGCEKVLANLKWFRVCAIITGNKRNRDPVRLDVNKAGKWLFFATV